MALLPALSGREVVRVFESFGWKVARHGNHIVMVRERDEVCRQAVKLRPKRFSVEFTGKMAKDAVIVL